MTARVGIIMGSASDWETLQPAAELLTQATEAGVTFVRGSDFFPGGKGGADSARLAFGWRILGDAPERAGAAWPAHRTSPSVALSA